MAPFSAGECVRVTVDGADGKVSRRALVLTIDDDDTLECEFRGETEEVRVQASTCTPLLPFELAEGPVDAETRKAQGNELFKLRDASAALEQYVLGLKSMQSDAPLSSAAVALSKPAPVHTRAKAAAGLVAAYCYALRWCWQLMSPTVVLMCHMSPTRPQIPAAAWVRLWVRPPRPLGALQSRSACRRCFGRRRPSTIRTRPRG